MDVTLLIKFDRLAPVVEGACNIYLASRVLPAARKRQQAKSRSWETRCMSFSKDLPLSGAFTQSPSLWELSDQYAAQGPLWAGD